VPDHNDGPATMDTMHIVPQADSDRLFQWARGPQTTMQPPATALCGQWSANRSTPGERWQSFGQWHAGAKMNNCPRCEAIAHKQMGDRAQYEANRERPTTTEADIEASLHAEAMSCTSSMND